MNNKKGTLMLSILFAIFLFLIGIVFVNFIMGDIDTARVGLDCSNTSNISDGTKLTCLVVDGVIPYFIILVVSLAGGLIFEKLTI